MTRPLSRIPFLIAALLVVVYAIEATIARLPIAAAAPRVLVSAILFDLLVFVPLLCWFAVLRPGGKGWQSLLLVYLLSLNGALLVLGPQHEQVGWLRWLSGPLEIINLLLVAGRIRRTLKERPGGDTGTQTRAVLTSIFGNAVAVELVAAELVVVQYGLLSWRAPTPTGPNRFGTVEKCGWGGMVGGLVLVSLLEAVAVHFLIAQKSPVLAWLCTALSLYGALWLIADWQAARLNPVMIQGTGPDATLTITAGLRGSATLPLGQIAEARRVLSHPARRVPGYVKLVTFGPPQFRLHLHEPVTIHGPFGLRRQALYIGLAVDDPEAFAAAFAACGSSSDSAM